MIFIVGIKRLYSEAEFTFENSDEAMSFAKTAMTYGEHGLHVNIELREEEEINDNDD